MRGADPTTHRAVQTMLWHRRSLRALGPSELLCLAHTAPMVMGLTATSVQQCMSPSKISAAPGTCVLTVSF